ncbi:MAG: succinate dehydrogenase [Chlamydiia bacterium]|nr:succinate dehydrogenase [Chlamydiia bacterium]
MSTKTAVISSEFLWRRIHSFTGFWLVLYLFLHLITNSQAGLWIGEDGHGFIRMVNKLESLPYLQVIEVLLIAVPIAIHGIWGIKRALQARLNQKKNSGAAPYLPYSRNHAFAWQRLTSWILLFGIIGHVAQMRFLDAPKKAVISRGETYFVKITFDEGLYTLTSRLHVALFTPQEVSQIKEELRAREDIKLPTLSKSATFEPDQQMARVLLQEAKEEKAWMQKLASYHLKSSELVAVTATPGTAYLLMVRNTFKNPVMAIFYTIFLLAAVFHAGNGLWTFLITWGALLSFRSQKAMIPISLFAMLLLSVLGMAAIWCSYWVNLRV